MLALMPRFLSALLLSLLLISGADAKQTAYNMKKENTEWAFSYAWRDADKKKQSVSFELPANTVKADIEISVRFPAAELLDAQLSAVRKYAESLPNGVKLTASKEDGTLQMRVTSNNGRKSMKSALKGAQAAAEQARDDWAKKNGYLMIDENTLMVDYTKIVVQYIDDVGPVAAALGAGKVDASDPASVRAYLSRALSFVQNIPYEERASGDAGFRRPLSLLARNKGDCDGKSALFLALARAALPDLKAGIVLIPGHAFVAVAIPAEKGDFTFKEDGVTYVAMEPVGPAVTAIGKVGSKSGSKVRIGASDFYPLPG